MCLINFRFTIISFVNIHYPYVVWMKFLKLPGLKRAGHLEAPIASLRGLVGTALELLFLCLVKEGWCEERMWMGACLVALEGTALTKGDT